MEYTGYQVHVKKRIPFLQALLDFYCGNALISFEGNLSAADFREIPVISSEPTELLRRGTKWPLYDFVILPLEEATLDLLKKNVLNQIGVQKKVDHILIAKNEEKVTVIHDRFHPDSVWVRRDFPSTTLQELQEKKVISSYKPVTWGK
ncbi:hypothetical protein [Candidatus Leptofilum sp.]|uniref:hypothetical protein n=1 Tax=Candidatus Leptofilum sp. TaxID=3241576 RepID=UPI003B5CF049